MADFDKENYAGGFYAVMRHLENKEKPYRNALAVLPAPEVDLKALARDITPTPEPDPALPDKRDARFKLHTLQQELTGQPQLHLVHAMCIALLRRNPAPPEARALFLRIWHEEGVWMAKTLPVRWLISSATTFADHGETMNQRLGGQGLSLLFDLIKLHDSERRLSGQRNQDAFKLDSDAHKQMPLAFDMTGYSLRNGDMDRNMLARLWRYAENDPVLRPLGFRMLKLVMYDPRSIFGRLQQYKSRSSILDDLNG